MNLTIHQVTDIELDTPGRTTNSKTWRRIVIHTSDGQKVELTLFADSELNDEALRQLTPWSN